MDRIDCRENNDKHKVYQLTCDEREEQNAMKDIL